MKKFDFSVLIAELQKLVQRFPFVVFSVLGLTAVFLADINDWDKNIEPGVYVFFIYAILVTFSVALATERRYSTVLKSLVSLVAIALLAIYAFTLPDKLSENQILQHVILGVIFFITLFVIAFFRKDNDENFWEFGKRNIVRMVLAYVFSGILMGGLTLAVISLQELFSIQMSDKVFQNLAVFCLFLFSVIYYLMHVPGIEEKYSLQIDFSKALKFLSMYILIPVLGLYLVILYVYMFKIIASWELPNGWVTTLISVLGLIGFLTIIILYPMIKSRENKLINFLGKYFPLMILPLLILMSVAIFRRIDDYGLTINRLYAVRLNVWLYGVSIFLFITASRYPKWILISLLAIALVSTWGPLNSFVVTKNMLLTSWTNNLEKAGLYKDNQIVLPDSGYVATEKVDYKRIVDVYTYLRDNFGKEVFHPYFPSQKDEKLSSAMLSLNKLKKEIPKSKSEDEGFTTGYFRLKNNFNVTDVPVASQMLSISWNKFREENRSDPADSLKVDMKNNVLIVQYKQNSVKIPLDQFVNQLIFNSLQQGTMAEGTIAEKNYKLIIQEINFNYFSESRTLKEVTNIDALIFVNK